MPPEQRKLQDNVIHIQTQEVVTNWHKFMKREADVLVPTNLKNHPPKKYRGDKCRGDVSGI
jgi:hypothetical protein